MIYEIVKFDLKGATLYTKKKRHDLYKGDDKKIYTNNTKEEAHKTHLWHYTDNPNQGAFDADDEFLPYFADVTEDLPNSVKKHGLEPKTYKNCQLMTEKYGGYLQFWDKKTKQALRIAINSHYYNPIN